MIDNREPALPSEVDLGLFFEINPDLFCIITNEGSIQKLNKTWETLLGYTPKEILYRNIVEFLHPEDLKKAFTEGEQNLSTGASIFTCRFRSQQGEYKWIEWHWKRQSDEKYIYAVGRDVTERKNLIYDLNERVKELKCRGRVSELTLNTRFSIQELCERILTFLPDAFQDPGNTGAAIIIYGKQYVTPNYKHGAGEVITQDIKIDERTIGQIRVCYLKDQIHESGQLFLPEECEMLFAIAIRIGSFIDKKEKEKALAENRQMYQMLTENISDVIWTFNLKTRRYTYVSPSNIYLTGLTPEEAMQLSIEETFTADSVEIIRDDMEKRINEYYKTPLLIHKSHKIELQQYYRDGTAFWVEMNIRLHEDANGELELIGVSRSIEKRKRMEDILKESEEQYRSLFENINIGLYRSTPDGNFLIANPAALTILGFDSFEELVRENPRKNFEYTISSELIYQIVDQNGEIHNLEFEWQRKDGSKVFIREQFKAVRDENGSLLYYEGILQDFTQQRKAEQLLVESEKKLKTIFELIDIGISISDESGKHLERNYAANMILELWDDKVDYRNLQWVKPDLTPMSIEDFAYRKALKMNEPVRNVEMGFVRSDGSIKWITVNSTPLGMAGYGAVSTFIDITEKKNAEDLNRKRTDELRKANAAKDKLFSIISHDLRGPVSSFHLSLEMLNSNINIDEKMRKQILEELRDEAKSTLGLLDNLLNWSRSQSNKIRIMPEVFILNYSIWENVDLLGPLARQKSIDIQVDVEEIINVFADIETINLVIRNLLSNAIKFTPCNGKIIVKACDDGEKVVVSVEDNGVGMDPGVLESLFKPDIFFTTYGTENEKGSGLGLILCKDFVEKNGGNIIVESESGKGSRFIFTVPRE